MPPVQTAKLPAIALFRSGAEPDLDALMTGLADAGFAKVELTPADGNIVTGLRIRPVGAGAVTISPPGNDPGTKFDVTSLITVLVASGGPKRPKGKDGAKGKTPAERLREPPRGPGRGGIPRRPSP
jgi:hypothetical protein